MARLHLEEEVQRVARERRATEERLRRLGQVYLDELLDYDEYRRQKRQLEEKLGSLIVPGIEAAQQAGKLLEHLPQLWDAADLGERRKILMTMLAAVYVETVQERAVVALQPKPAFQALFQLATTRDGSGVVLYPEHENPPIAIGGFYFVFVVETGEAPSTSTPNFPSHHSPPRTPSLVSLYRSLGRLAA